MPNIKVDLEPKVNLKALNHVDPDVVSRMVREYGLTQADAEKLQSDTLKFLSLADCGFTLSPPARIDLGWHNFILHTPNYRRFCQESFGRFIDHIPGSGHEPSSTRLTVNETIELARSIYGELSENWTNDRGATCGSGGC